MELVKKQVPQTKVEVRSVSITGLSPSELPDLMAKHNIPDNAYFDGRNNGYDAWDDILLSWEVSVPTTEEDKLKFIKKHFNAAAFPQVYSLLTTNGYKRVGFNSACLKEFSGTSAYDMYVAGDYDRLIKYYSLYFTLENKN